MSAEVASTLPRPAGGPNRWWLNPRIVVSVFLVLVLWPSLMYPLPGPLDISLDGSWPGVLQYAHEHGWQFGKDIVFTWGPWGFLNNYVHLGGTGATTKILWETLGKLGIAIALVVLTRRLPLLNQILFVVGCVCFSWLFLDSIFLVLITIAVFCALLRDDRPWWEHLIWMLVLCFLGQFKFTYTVFGGIGIGAATGLRILRRQWKRAAGMAGSFAVVYILLWIISGQNPDNLYPFFRLSLQISSGYADAMGINEPSAVFLWGAALALTCSIFVYRLFARHNDRSYGIAAAAYLALTWYVVWKHSYVRADSHVFGFYIYTLLLALVLPPLCFPKTPWHWFYIAVVLAGACFEIFDPGLLTRCPQVAWRRTTENYRILFQVSSLPSRWQQDYEQARNTAQLPSVKKQVGQASIDVFNYNQGVAILNDLNYRPRPIYQSYSAYTPRLAARNLKFYQSDRAPEYVLWRQVSIDSRYPTIDDSLLIPELPGMYQPVLTEGDYLLLKRRPGVHTGRLERSLLVTRSLRLGETMELPPDFERPLWLQARLPLNKLGHLRAVLYKPPMLTLVVKDNYGSEYAWRILPRIAEDGFLLSPLLETQEDFASYMRGRGQKWIRSLRLEAPKPDREFWARIWDCADISLYALPGLKMTPGQIMEAWVEHGITNLLPVSAHAAINPQLFDTGTNRALLMHAPSSMDFKPADSDAHLSGTFGLRDQAFQGENQSNGVDFVVEQIQSDGTLSVLFRRPLRPLQIVADRGPQTFSIALPPGTGRKITLRLLPGDKDDSRWDWSYLTDIKFTSSPQP
ncbi:MAG: hypothetical protein QM715_03765 [Nibricoccus sp.]